MEEEEEGKARVTLILAQARTRRAQGWQGSGVITPCCPERTFPSFPSRASHRLSHLNQARALSAAWRYAF